MTLPVDQLRLTAMMEDLDRAHSAQSKQQRRDALDALTTESESWTTYKGSRDQQVALAVQEIQRRQMEEGVKRRDVELMAQGINSVPLTLPVTNTVYPSHTYGDFGVRQNPTTGHYSSLLDETYRLKALQSEPDQTSVPYRKLLEELHRLAAENRTLKAAQTTEVAPAQRLSASWEHLPDVIPTTPTKNTSRETQAFPFAALRKGNQQPVGLLTGFPT